MAAFQHTPPTATASQPRLQVGYATSSVGMMTSENYINVSGIHKSVMATTATIAIMKIVSNK